MWWRSIEKVKSRGLGRTDKCQPQNRNGKKRERETVKDFAEKTVQLYISHCPIIGVSPWRDLETTRGWKGASTSPRVLFALPRSSLPTLDPSILVVVVASHRAFEKLISLPRLTRFLVRGRFLRGVVILC